MESVLQKWHLFCQKNVPFDTSEFFTLFLSDPSETDLSEKEIYKALSYFPGAEEMAQKVIELRKENNLRGEYYHNPSNIPDLDKPKLLNLTQNHIKEMKTFCVSEKEDDLINILTNAKLAYCDDKKIFDQIQKDYPADYDLYEAINDFVIGNLVKHDKIYALLEALYGMNSDYYLSYYIAQPLIKGEINFEPYFHLWKAGGDCVITQDIIYVRSIFDKTASTLG